MDIPRKEHPKPQFERAAWTNLNGTWDFEIDNGRSGQARGLYETQAGFSVSCTGAGSRPAPDRTQRSVDWTGRGHPPHPSRRPP